MDSLFRARKQPARDGIPCIMSKSRGSSREPMLEKCPCFGPFQAAANGVEDPATESSGSSIKTEPIGHVDFKRQPTEFEFNIGTEAEKPLLEHQAQNFLAEQGFGACRIKRGIQAIASFETDQKVFAWKGRKFEKVERPIHRVHSEEALVPLASSPMLP